MPHKAFSHSENRCKVCFLCFRKQKVMIEIKGKLKSDLTNVITNYIDEENLPAALCSTCRRRVYEAKASKTTLKSPDLSIFQC